jgi:Family of unknown function (DUF6232)
MSNLFGNNQSITIDRSKLITVTNKTVRFESSVYQTHNIASFTEGEVEIGGIPWIFLVILTVIGLISISFNAFLGWMLFLAGIAGIVYNFSKPKHRGLLITLNSGDKRLFVAREEGLEKVVEEIYTLIEKESNASYKISIANSQIQGNFVQGNIGGDAIYKSRD